GGVEAADEAAAEACFEERPRGSRITAWISRQGRSLLRRSDLDAAWAKGEARFDGVDPIPRPAAWRAYRLVPESVELWQAAANRLHDRLLFHRVAEGWRVERLWP
ncbi:MAG: pyridoxamine 5'-phosphate oxidase, partial [Acidobacteria bacterium]|nr:pyridoxamine 5'-phosphate oxidase [Acidobacteriota bacterium]